MDYQAMVSLALKDEEKNMKIAAGTVVAVTILLLILALIWPAILGTVPPPGQKQYELMGSIDFGMDDLGQMDVNNFEDPSPTPSEEAPAESQEVQETEPVQETVTSNEIVTTTDETAEEAVVNNTSEIKDPDPDPKPPKRDPDPVVRDEVPDFNTNNNSNSDDGTSSNNSGSNHGDSDEAGNRGTDADVLNQDGMFTFVGDGSGNGLNGRRPIALPQPEYNVQEESKITFKFKIDPSGKVAYVKPPITPHAGLKKAGMEAIYKWKFNKVPDKNGDQWTQVTITFRLK